MGLMRTSLAEGSGRGRLRVHVGRHRGAHAHAHRGDVGGIEFGAHDQRARGQQRQGRGARFQASALPGRHAHDHAVLRRAQLELLQCDLGLFQALLRDRRLAVATATSDWASRRRCCASSASWGCAARRAPPAHNARRPASARAGGPRRPAAARGPASARKWRPRRRPRTPGWPAPAAAGHAARGRPRAPSGWPQCRPAPAPAPPARRRLRSCPGRPPPRAGRPAPAAVPPSLGIAALGTRAQRQDRHDEERANARPTNASCFCS